MDKKELFGMRRLSSCKSVGQFDEQCEAFDADIRRIDSFIAKHRPIVEVDCLSESAASPTKVRPSSRDPRSRNVKGLMTEGNVSARSAAGFSQGIALSAAEHEELNQDM